MKVAASLLVALLGTAALTQAQTPRALPALPVNPPAASPAATPPPAPVPAVPPANLHRLIRDLQANTDNIKSQGDFGAQLWLIANEGFFQDWRKPETPAIDPQDATTRGRPLFTVVVFYGPARDGKGQSEVTYDLVVKRPDGSIYHESKGLVGHQAAAPAEARMLMLGRSYLNINPGPDDPVGKYTVEATVYDGVAKTSVPLKKEFMLRDDPPPTPEAPAASSPVSGNTLPGHP